MAQNTGTTGETAGQSLGNTVKAGWNVVHGAGEALRGNINDGLDQVGEQVAGRGGQTHTQTQPHSQIGVTHTEPATRTEGGKKPEQVAANGANEMESGLRQLRQ